MTDLFTQRDAQPQDVYTVSRLNFEVAGLLSGTFPAFWITGEISNIATPPSGHIYFSLKDAKAQVRCAMFKHKTRGLGFRPSNGQQVLLQANVGLYEVRGDYQLNVLKMSEAGEGALRQKFEDLKNNLQAKGWFDETHKKPLPKIPQTIGLITSKDGAAIHDICVTFAKRFPSIDIIVYPTLVQGAAASEQIAKMIRIANQRKECDALIVGRGGGSLEDLWAFNELAVVQAIYESTLPIVSAVGHESNVSIADFVADYRAATPTAAAQALSPDAVALNQHLTSLAKQLSQRALEQVKDKQRQLLVLTHALPDVQARYAQWAMRLDELGLRLQHKTEQTLAQHKVQISGLHKRLVVQHPVSLLRTTTSRLSDLEKRLSARKPATKEFTKQVANLNQRLQRASALCFAQNQQKLNSLGSRMDMASPLKTLERGYAIASDKTGAVLVDAKTLKQGDEVVVRLAKGQLNTTVQ